jgi:hypothetical protein
MHQDHVPTLMDEIASHRPSKRSSVCAANPCGSFPRGVLINNAVSIDAAVSMTEIEQEDWVEEFLNSGMDGMLNMQFDNLIAEDESDLSCLYCCSYSEQYTS